MNTQLNTSPKAWYRHPWPWILISGPLIVVIAGFYTAYIAVVSYDGLVVDDYYKEGMTVNQTAHRERTAHELGLQATISQDMQRKLVRVVLSSPAPMVFPDTLKLDLKHPTRSGQDQSGLLLQAEKTLSEPLLSATYSAGIPVFLSGRWRVALENEQRDWRLTDIWSIDTSSELKLPAEPAKPIGLPHDKQKIAG